MSASAIPFTEFCAWLGVRLEPGQLVFARVCFDGVEPCDLVGEEREIARAMFGPDVDTVPPAARRVIVTVTGGRGGKSYLMSLRALHLALTVDLRTIAPGQQPSTTITAPDKDLAQENINYIRGAIRMRPELLARAVFGHEADSKSLAIGLRRGDITVVLVARAAGAKGRTGRGRSMPCAVIDEGAIFNNADHKVSDRDVFKAMRPRVMSGGQMLVGSTPWGEDGLLYELHRDNWNKPSTCLVAWAPTRLVRTDPDILATVAAEYERDQENAEREFGAQFMASAGTAFFLPSLITAAVDASIVLGELPGSDVDEVCAGGDFAFRTNSSALAIAHRVGDVVSVAALEERKPSKAEPLRPSVTARDFASVVRVHGSDVLWADGHSFDAVAEHTAAHDVYLSEAPSGQAGKVETYSRVRTLLREGRLRLPAHPKLIEQLKAVRARPTSGGGLTITSPVSAGGEHGDLVSAVVLAVSQMSGVADDAPVNERRDADEPTRPWMRPADLGTGDEPAWW